VNFKKNESVEMKDYWQKNIEAYGKFYDEISEEKIIAHPIVDYFYKKLIFPLERDGNLERYRKTVSFIEKNVNENSVVVDLGCGTGVFTTEILRCKGYVICVDFAESALIATRKRIESMMPQYEKNVEYLLLDIMDARLPKSDIVICIGVTPYIDSLEKFFDHILPTTEKFYCLFLNNKNWMNRFRKVIPWLNVRKYYFHNIDEIDDYLTKFKFIRVSRDKLCTGFLDEMHHI
jgi:SAM-dependent methyltransferase